MMLTLGCLALTFSCQTKKSESSTPEVPTDNPEVTEVLNQEITTMEVTYYAADSTALQGYFAAPVSAGNSVPGVLVVHEWWGHNEYARQRARDLAALGYAALAVDMYGEGKTAEHPEDAGKFAGMVMQNLETARERFEAGLTALKAQSGVDPERIGAIGYCFGGSVALTMANSGYDLDAVAVFHSGVQLPVMPTSDLKAKVLVCNGAEDPMVTAESVATFKRMMDSIGASYEYIAYENATHSFTSKAADSLGKKFNMPIAYNAEADSKSWEEMKKLFKVTWP